MANPRTIARLEAQIQRRAAHCLMFEIADPRSNFITITRVELATDLHSGKIFYSVLGDEGELSKASHMLEHAAGFIQRQVATVLHIRNIPHLRWVYDDTIAEAARLDSIARQLLPVTEELAELRALGPSYIPYDRGPRPVWDTEMQAKVTTTLLPVIRAEELVARTRAYFWLLVRADGTVDEVVLQTSSGSSAFDEAAARVARALLFAPAIRGQRAVPTWVVRDVSLIMQ